MKVVQMWVVAEGAIQHYSLAYLGKLSEDLFFAIYALTTLFLDKPQEDPMIRVFMGRADESLEEVKDATDHRWSWADGVNTRKIETEKGWFNFRDDGISTFDGKPIELLQPVSY